MPFMTEEMQNELVALCELGKSKGMLTIDEVSDRLAPMQPDAEQLEIVLGRLREEKIALVDDVDACTCAGSCGSGSVKICSLASRKFQEIYEQYASWEWRYGKSPECETVCQKRFDWGEVQVHMKLKNLFIEECKVYSDALDVELPQKIETLIQGQRFDMQNVKTEDKQLNEVITWLRLLHA